MSQISKLTIVTRGDLTPGYQSSQATHSALLFSQEHPYIFQQWLNQPYIVLLSIKNEQELKKLIFKLKKSNLYFSVFTEPDIDNQITAVCIEPSEKTRRFTSSLPLMLRQYNTNDKIDKNNFIKEEQYEKA